MIMTNTAQAYASNMPLKNRSFDDTVSRATALADKKKKKKKTNANNPLYNPSPVVPHPTVSIPTASTPVTSTPVTSTPVTSTPTDFQTLADLYRDIFGAQFGSNPQTSQSGESALVVPGVEDSGGDSNKGLIIIVLIVAGIAGYMYYKRKKAE